MTVYTGTKERVTDVPPHIKDEWAKKAAESERTGIWSI